MRSSLPTMGGGTKIRFPSHVWTPTGGWYANPKNWKRNTMVVAGGIAFLSFLIYRKGESLQRRPVGAQWPGAGGRDEAPTAEEVARSHPREYS